MTGEKDMPGFVNPAVDDVAEAKKREARFDRE